MKYLFLSVIMLTSTAFAGLDMKPGLWKIKMLVKSNGKEMNPTAQMSKVMAKIPVAQRKQMMEAIGKHSVGFNADGTSQVCYSKDMINNPEKLIEKEEKKKCTSQIISNTSRKLVTTFKCEDGTTGKATMDLKSSEAYKSLVNLTNKKGERSEITTEGSFVKADCGTLRPII